MIGGKRRVAMVTTHPIQYQVPWLQRLARVEGIELKVFFAMIPDSAEQGREFGVSFDWDVPLLEGYEYEVLPNVSRNPSTVEFAGCDTPEVRSRISKGGFDAVIVNGWGSRTALQALAACRLAGIPCVLRGEANGLRPRPFWKRFGHRLLLSQYAAFLAIGTNNRDYYRSLGVPAGKIFSTPYCVDNERFRTGAEQWRRSMNRDELRARFGLAPDVPTFLFSGKFVPKKRPADIVAAVRELAAAGHAGVQVLMVGEGPLGESLREASQGLPIRYSGFLNQGEISAAYAASDCLLLPSDSGETWGLVVNEAMACGLPAIVSDRVGCEVDLVRPGQTGARFPCGDIQALSRAMTDFTAAQQGKMGDAALALVHEGYTFDRVVQGVLEALESLPTVVH